MKQRTSLDQSVRCIAALPSACLLDEGPIGYNLDSPGSVAIPTASCTVLRCSRSVCCRGRVSVQDDSYHGHEEDVRESSRRRARHSTESSRSERGERPRVASIVGEVTRRLHERSGSPTSSQVGRGGSGASLWGTLASGDRSWGLKGSGRVSALTC